MAAKSEILKYTIHGYSSFSSNYVADNILEDKPNDQSSRWSSDSNSAPQFIVLRLRCPAIVQCITFGKYEKTHVCNLRKFKVYGGLEDENTILLLEGGLKNDHQSESFALKHKIDANYFPCKYIKIEPIASWGPNFNFSIWHVQLHGVEDPVQVKPCMNWYNTYREREAIRLCLKHFRQNQYTEAFDALLKKTNVALEDQLLTDLHTQLVIDGDYDACERLIEKACDDGFFNNFISQQEYLPKWNALEPAKKGFSSECCPGMRGGHQMCIDASADTIYLFGGWDGNDDLADLWSYDLLTEQWTCLSKNTEDEGGPSARSCHKMCIDTDRKQIFTIGKFLDSAMRTQENLKSDFYMYDITSGKWTLISDDTSGMGGPKLIFDHQMAIDVKNTTIYIFGGRIQKLSGGEATGIERVEASFSGLFYYHIPTNTWYRIMDDCPVLRSRIGHSMLFHPMQRALYIFAGQRSKEFLKDFLIYNVDSGDVQTISDGTKQDDSQVPATGFTQRATLDPDSSEIHVLSGVRKEKDRNNVKNSFWVYDIKKGKWSCIYKNEHAGQHYWEKMQHVEPVPRFAHQLVYNHITKVHYLFGGNPGKDSLPKMRLDDFWALKLCRPSVEHLLRRCKFLIRKHQFQEIVLRNPLSAMSYLQSEVQATVNLKDKEEREQFHALGSILLDNGQKKEEDMDFDIMPVADQHFVERTKLYDTLVSYFPECMSQPKANLIDLITPR